MDKSRLIQHISIKTGIGIRDDGSAAAGGIKICGPRSSDHPINIPVAIHGVQCMHEQRFADSFSPLVCIDACGTKIPPRRCIVAGESQYLRSADSYKAFGRDSQNGIGGLIRPRQAEVMGDSFPHWR